MEKLKDHNIAKLFPLLEGEEFEVLKADIEKNGLIEPLVLHPDDDSIIDGRNRYRACLELKISPVYCYWDKCGSLVAYVVSRNLHRRHLNSSQRAMISVDMLPMLEAEAKERQRMGREQIPYPEQAGKASEHAAAIVGSNPRYVSDAKKISQEAPELAEEIRAGKKTITETKRELKEQAKEEKRKADGIRVRRTKKPEELDGVFSTILIDPPWDYSEEGDNDAFGRTRPTYNQESLEDIKAWPVGEKAATDGHLYLWITNRSLLAGKGWEVCEAWGFRPITIITWCKPSIGVGNYFRNNTEHVIFAVRGQLGLSRSDVGTWFEAKRGPDGHSSKPSEFYEIIESCSPPPYLELFSRCKREAWVSWGNGI